MKSIQIILLIIISMNLNSCVMSSTNSNEIKKIMANRSDSDLEPHYKMIFKPDSLELLDAKNFENKSEINTWESFNYISNSSKELKSDFLNFLLDVYGTANPKTEDRLSYQEIGNIANYIVRNYKKEKMSDFEEIFKRIEFCLTKGTESTQDLMVVGLFEGIQNIGGWYGIDYTTGFDKWLKSESKKSWMEVIEFWEGKK